MTPIHRGDVRFAAGVILTLCLLAITPVVTAADAPAPDTGALQEIVVTAQHKEENVQSTPIAMSVYTGDAVKENNIVDIAGRCGPLRATVTVA